MHRQPPVVRANVGLIDSGDLAAGQRPAFALSRKMDCGLAVPAQKFVGVTKAAPAASRATSRSTDRVQADAAE
jgi:hypothetical protein